MDETIFSIKEYESSNIWKNKSKKLLDNKECECAICHKKRWLWQPRKKTWKRILRFSVHHITYKDVPNEKPEQLLILCYTCHETAHLILRLETRGGMWAELAEVIKRYFKYDKELPTLLG